jgi:Holliday junction resolvase
MKHRKYRTYVSTHELTDLSIKWAEIAAGEKSRSRKDTTSEGAAMILIIEIHNSYAVSSRIYIGGNKIHLITTWSVSSMCILVN